MLHRALPGESLQPKAATLGAGLSSSRRVRAVTLSTTGSHCGMKTEGALTMRFSGIRNLSVRCVVTSLKLGPGCRFPGRRRKLAGPGPRNRRLPVFATRPSGPSPSYSARRKERALPIVHDEFRRLFPEGSLASVALLRFTGHDQHKSIASSKGTIYHRTVTCVLTVCLRKRTGAVGIFGGRKSCELLAWALVFRITIRTRLRCGSVP